MFPCRKRALLQKKHLPLTKINGAHLLAAFCVLHCASALQPCPDQDPAFCKDNLQTTEDKIAKCKEPQYLEVVQQAANLAQLKQDNHEKEQFEPHKGSGSAARRGA